MGRLVVADPVDGGETGATMLGGGTFAMTYGRRKMSDEEGSGDSGFPDVSASIGSGFGSIVDGVVDAAKSAGDAALNAAYVVGDTAEIAYHSFAAAGDAGVGDMAGANAQNDAANAEVDEVFEDVGNIRKDIGF